jgi:hypothetical protein
LDRGEEREALRITQAGQETVILADEDGSAFKAYAFYADRSSEIAIITQAERSFCAQFTYFAKKKDKY